MGVFNQHIVKLRDYTGTNVCHSMGYVYKMEGCLDVQSKNFNS